MIHSMWFLFATCFLLSSRSTYAHGSHGKQGKLLKGVNAYRASLQLAPLSHNENAECLADELAKNLEGKACTNESVPATLPEPRLLAHCHLNVSTAEDAVILPSCVLGLESEAVLASYTKTEYAKYLNDSQFVGAGIASEDDWMVLILTTNTPSGSLSIASRSILKMLPLTIAIILSFFSYWV